MARIFLLISFGLLISAFSQSQPKQSDLDRDGLRGRVRQIEVHTYAYDKEFDTYEVTRFDTTGTISSKIEYDLFGDIHRYYRFKYNSVGKRLADDMYFADSTLESHVEYTYDSLGNEVSVCVYVGDAYNQKWIYKYNNHGMQIMEFWLIHDSTKISATHVNKYDAKGHKIESVEYPGEDTLSKPSYRITCKYDDHDNIIEKNIFLGIGALYNQVRFKYVYDSRGNWTRKSEILMFLPAQGTTERIPNRDNIPTYVVTREITYYP